MIVLHSATEQPTHGGKFPDDPTVTKRCRQHGQAEPPHDALAGRAASSTPIAPDLQPLFHSPAPASAAPTTPPVEEADYGEEEDEAEPAEDPSTVEEADPATEQIKKGRETAYAIINAFLDRPSF